MATLFTVMAASVNGRVVLWEVNPQHPGGEVYISGDGRAVQVALTPTVQHKIDAGDLVKVVTVQSEPEPEPQPETEPAGNESHYDYANMTAAAIVEIIPTLTDAQKAELLAYETAHKNRATVLKALQ